jgi:hypothetical protein
MKKPKQPLVSVLERVAQRKIKLATYGPAKRVLLWIGWRVARVTKGRWDRVEPRKELGQEFQVRVYKAGWWDAFGDGFVDQQLARLARHPEWLDVGKLPGDTKKAETTLP